MIIALENYGNILGHELMNEGTFKNLIAKRYYVLKFQKYYLKFDFTLYNNGNNWNITDFTFDVEPPEILNYSGNSCLL